MKRLTPAVKWLLGVTTACFLIFTFAGKALQAQLIEWLLLTPGAILQGQVWKLATTVLLPDSPFSFVMNALMLWFFMPFLERAWGTRRFVILGAATTFAAYAVSTLVGIILGGPHLHENVAGITAFIYAGIVGYGVDFAREPLSLFGAIPMKGKSLAIGMSVLIVVVTIWNRAWVTGSGHIAAMVTAFLMTSHHITPKLWLLRWRHARLRRRYKVLDGGAGKKWMN